MELHVACYGHGEGEQMPLMPCNQGKSRAFKLETRHLREGNCHHAARVERRQPGRVALAVAVPPAGHDAALRTICRKTECTREGHHNDTRIL
jgi:hypothetical protein